MTMSHRDPFVAYREGRIADCIDGLNTLPPHASTILAARCLIRRRDFENALLLIEKHCRLLVKYGDAEQISEASTLLASVLTNLGDREAAQRALTQAKAYVLGTPNERLLLDVLLQQAVLDITNGATQRSLALTDFILVRGGPVQRAKARSIAVTRLEVTDPNLALDWAIDAVDDVATTDNHVVIAGTLKNLATMALRAERFDILETVRIKLSHLPWSEGAAAEKRRALLLVAEADLIRGDVARCSEALSLAREVATDSTETIHLLRLEAMIAAIKEDRVRLASLVAKSIEVLAYVPQPALATLDLAYPIQQLQQWDANMAIFSLTELLEASSKMHCHLSFKNPLVQSCLIGIEGLLQSVRGDLKPGLVNCGLAFESLRLGAGMHDAAIYAAQIAEVTRSEHHLEFLRDVSSRYPTGYSAHVNRRILSAV